MVRSQKPESVLERLKTGPKVTMEYMNSFYPEEFQVKEFAYKSDLTLDQAKEKYPEWYQKTNHRKETEKDMDI